MKKYLGITALFIFCSAVVFAQAEAVETKKIAYKTVNSKQLYADIFYTVDERRIDKPAIALFHGGGWVSGDPSEFYEACRRWARKGFVAVSFQYRLSINEDGTYPHPDITPVESTKDARSAIRWLRENATELHINPDKIAVGGQSAGGQLALATALCDTIDESTDNLEVSPAPNALLLFSSNVNTIEAWIDMLLGDRRNEIWSISPYHNLKKQMPPAIAFHGEEDDQVLFYIVQMFRARMATLDNYYELYTYAGRKHYLAAGNDKYATYFDEKILQKTDDFLQKFDFLPADE